MNELKRKLALWICPELGEEIAESKKDITWLKDKTKSTYETLSLTKESLEATEQALSKERRENLQLIVELSTKEKAIKKLEQAGKESGKKLERLEKRHKDLERRHLFLKGLYDTARAHLDKVCSRQSKDRRDNR